MASDAVAPCPEPPLAKALAPAHGDTVNLEVSVSGGSSASVKVNNRAPDVGAGMEAVRVLVRGIVRAEGLGPSGRWRRLASPPSQLSPWTWCTAWPRC